MGKSLSVLKRTRQSEKRREINLIYKERVKKAKKGIKKLLEIKAGKEELMKAYSEYSSTVDKASKKSIFHKNNAARKKSRMNLIIKKFLLNKSN
ncbi:MAG TPA: 30S ribosomal protein S20 [Spirochaetia bacterium]|nr:MAG: 30S ribosomal protein S20 [Spirochaetes bacterium GWB1_36_13]HCL55747.1 30S ribosomal protein S20 [Spirochaetia bacterium]